MTADENIERLSRDILQQAESEAEVLISDAKKKADQLLESAREQAETVRNQLLEKARRDSERIRSQAIATTQLKVRTMQLEAREALLQDVFAAALKKLPTLQQRNDYSAIVEKMILEALSQIGSNNIVLHADKETIKILSSSFLSKINSSSSGSVQVGSILEEKTGISASTADGHLVFDNSFETRLQKLESNLRAPVYHLLMGESL